MKTIRVLVVSKNDVMVSNIKKWKSSEIESGSLIIDHAKNKQEADVFMMQNAYDIVLQNGISVIDSIEKYQEGVEFATIGKTRNNVYKHSVDAYSLDEINYLISQTAKKPLKNGVNIEASWKTVLGLVLSILVPLVIFWTTLDNKVNSNVEKIKTMEEDYKEMFKEIQKTNTNISEMKIYFEAYVKTRENSLNKK